MANATTPHRSGKVVVVWNRDAPHARRERLFNGRGAVLVWNLGEGGVLPPFGAILACELEPGASVGAHVQEEYAEVVIVFEGEGVARVGGAEEALTAGRIVEVALGQTLALENRSSERALRYLIVKAAGGTGA